MSDRILLSGIQFHGHHGVRKEERTLGQRFVVDVEFRLDLREAGRTDDLGATVDYERVHAAVVDIGTREQFKLLEALAARIASSLLERFPAHQVTVRVTKPSPPLPDLAGGVSVEITRP